MAEVRSQSDVVWPAPIVGRWPSLPEPLAESTLRLCQAARRRSQWRSGGMACLLLLGVGLVVRSSLDEPLSSTLNVVTWNIAAINNNPCAGPAPPSGASAARCAAAWPLRRSGCRGRRPLCGAGS
eukprot:scaffold1053_cov107-Isochrysis_galbana.AAC.24